MQILWKNCSSRLDILPVLWEEVAMRGLVIAIPILIIAIISGVILWGMFFAYLEAMSTRSALKLEFMAPVKMDVDWAEGLLTVNLIGVVRNTGPRDIEAEGGEYKIYIMQGGGRYVLAEGKIPPLHIDAYSSQAIPLSARISLLQLPKTLRSLIESGSGFQIYLELSLKIAVKFAGITLWTQPVTISEIIYPTR